MKKIKIGEVQPNETIEAVKEATLLSQVMSMVVGNEKRQGQ